MKVFLILYTLFQLTLAECDYDCDCPDLITLHSGDPAKRTYIQNTGCSQSLTTTSTQHVASFLKESSNIPGIEDGWLAPLFDTKTPSYELPALTKELFTEFGLVCINSTWFATTFPFGINAGNIYSAETANGKGYLARVEYLASV